MPHMEEQEQQGMGFEDKPFRHRPDQKIHPRNRILKLLDVEATMKASWNVSLDSGESML